MGMWLLRPFFLAVSIYSLDLKFLSTNQLPHLYKTLWLLDGMGASFKYESNSTASAPKVLGFASGASFTSI
jgi:hypothetical protein